MTTKLEQRLKQLQLVPSTRQKYQEIIAGAETDDLLSWIEQRVSERTPMGTILPLRAAVKHYLIAEQGYSDAELHDLLPKTQGMDAEHHKPLSSTQLAVYHAAVEQVDVDPAYTILKLLPLTGLRIGEITALKKDHIKWEGRDVNLVFQNQGGTERSVPLPDAAIRTIERYLDRMDPTDWLFCGYLGNPITPHAIRVYTRRIASEHPVLEGLCPHRLRATYAMMLVRKGVSLPAIQRALGHKTITTTHRYVYADLSELRAAVEPD